MFEVFFDNNNHEYLNLLNSILSSRLLKYFLLDLKFYYNDNYLVYFFPEKNEDYLIINLKKEEEEKDIFLENLENNYINNILQKYSYKNIIN